MNVVGIDRVMLASREPEALRDLLADLLGLSFRPRVEWHTGMPVYFSEHPPVEIIGPAEEDDEIGRYVDEHGQGLYGLALRVEDVEAAKAYLAERDIEPLFEDRIENLHEVIYHPKSFGGVYVVLAEHHHPIGDPLF